MKNVGTYNLSQSRAQCRPDDTSGARFVSVQREASGAHSATYSRHNRRNIFTRAIDALFGRANKITCKDLRAMHAQGKSLRLARYEDIQ